MLKFTKGLWTINPTGMKPIICIENDIEWPIVTQVSGESPKAIDANLRIIRASAEMYEVLSGLVADPVVKGMSARIRDCARRDLRTDYYDEAEFLLNVIENPLNKKRKA